MNKMIGWRTIVFNVLCALLTLTEMLGASTISPYLPEEWQLYWTLFVLVGNVVLRWLTTGPIAGWGPKEEPDAPVGS